MGSFILCAHQQGDQSEEDETGGTCGAHKEQIENLKKRDRFDGPDLSYCWGLNGAVSIEIIASMIG
jgi:hypothetical protein